jgi:hypothetical protein
VHKRRTAYTQHFERKQAILAHNLKGEKAAHIQKNKTKILPKRKRKENI